MDVKRLLKRFLRYVTIDTTAVEAATTYPSSPGQLELGELLVEELRAAGIADAQQDRYGIVLATVPSTVAEAVPTIALCAHLDTSPETSGTGVKPQVIQDYRGGDLILPGDPQQVLRVAEHPELAKLIGRTIITSDGATLLGADDKAGVAAIMETAVFLAEHPEIPHGPIRICFSCDEEIGCGVDHLPPDRIGATACYTLDGQGADTIDVETFSADLATVKIRGVNIHPGVAKDCMTNAIRVAADFLGRMPQRTRCPEHTEARQGFLHPVEIAGGVSEVTVRVLLREFDTPALAILADVLHRAAEATMVEFPQANIEVAIKSQYRNMAAGLAAEPRAVDFARQAMERLGRAPRLTIVRGGTDGSRLTEMGLPTPNLATGQHAPHSPQEWACLEEMAQAVQGLILLAQIWAENA